MIDIYGTPFIDIFCKSNTDVSERNSVFESNISTEIGGIGNVYRFIDDSQINFIFLVANDFNKYCDLDDKNISFINFHGRQPKAVIFENMKIKERLSYVDQGNIPRLAPTKIQKNSIFYYIEQIPFKIINNGNHFIFSEFNSNPSFENREIVSHNINTTTHFFFSIEEKSELENFISIHADLNKLYSKIFIGHSPSRSIIYKYSTENGKATLVKDIVIKNQWFSPDVYMPTGKGDIFSFHLAKSIVANLQIEKSLEQAQKFTIENIKRLIHKKF